MGNGKISSAARLLEALERRQLLSSVALSSGVLKITGNSSSANDLGVYVSDSNLVAKHNGAWKSYSASSVSRIEIVGGSASDSIWVTAGVTEPSVLRGAGGNDSVYGGGGRDTVYGGSGNDSVFGNDGNDSLRGEDGADTLFGGDGSDYLDGGTGNDVRYDEQFSGGVTSDVPLDEPAPEPEPEPEPDAEPTPAASSATLSSGILKVSGDSTSANQVALTVSGSNIVVTHNGATRSFASSSVTRIEIAGGASGDNLSISSDITKPSVIRGNGGNDTVSGGSGRDSIYGGSGNDSLRGHGGNDSLRGEDGEDTLYGGSGTDTLSGDTGNDVRYQDDTSTPVYDVPPTTDPETPPTGDGGGGSVPHDDSATAPKPVITARKTSIMAGQAIHVQGTGSSLGSGGPQNALYEWDFGDSGSEYNTLHGFNAAHVYADPGTYTIRLTVTNQAGQKNQTSITVNVSSDTRRVIYVSGAGSDSNSGSQSSPIKSWSKARSMLGSSSNAEVLFRRGDTFDAGSNWDITGSNVVVGAYGSGNRPVIRWTANVSGYPTMMGLQGSDISIQDLTFTSSVSNAPQALRPIGNNITIRDNQFLKLGYAINANGRPDAMLVQGNVAPDVTGIKSYFVWGEGTDHVYLGNTVSNSREEHVIRVVGADRVLVWDNNLTNTIGQASGDNTPKGALTLHKGSYYWVGRNRLNKGPVAIGPLGNGDGLDQKWARFRYGVFDGNVIDTKFAIDHGAERIMFRNNVVKSGETAILIEGYNSEYGRTTNDIALVNNTVINNASTGRFIKVLNGAAGVTLANNLYSAPSLTTGSGESASVYVEDSDLSSFKYIGNNVWANASASLWAQGGQNYVANNWSSQSGYKSASEWNGMSGVATDVFSDVAVSSSSYAPTSSGTANAAASEFMGVFHDLNGKVRDEWTAGAVEL